MFWTVKKNRLTFSLSLSLSLSVQVERDIQSEIEKLSSQVMEIVYKAVPNCFFIRTEHALSC